MTARKFNFDEADPGLANKAVRAAVEAKLQKMSLQAMKLAVDEKRWLRKKRLATTKLKNITALKRSLRRRQRAFEKTIPKG